MQLPISFLLSLTLQIQTAVSYLLNFNRNSIITLSEIKNKKTFELILPRFRGIETAKRFTQLDNVQISRNLETDVTIIGGGPAGLVLAALLAKKHSVGVVLVEPNIERKFPTNYGVWIDEWEELERQTGLGLPSWLAYRWPQTDCFYGGSHGVPLDQRLRLYREYARVDRKAMKAALLETLQQCSVVIVPSTVSPSGVDTSKTTSTTLKTSDGHTIQSKVVVDCSGHDSLLIEKDLSDGPHKPGYQIAYGIVLEVPDHSPYDDNSMLFMDYRDNFLADEDARKSKLQKEPTFMYAMPLGKGENGLKRIFVEETSLVARPMMSFDECKQRMFERFKFMGWDIKGYDYEEEEFCYIPMGGALPKRNQRLIGFGGAGSIVHPATGYMLTRVMAAASQLANSITKDLMQNGDAFDADNATQNAYDSMWFSKNKLQRDFAVFGGEYLMTQDVENLRGFFGAFFQLQQPVWSGFLSGWNSLPNNNRVDDWAGRVLMGVELWIRSPVSVKLGLMNTALFTGGWQFVRSVTPLGRIETQPPDVPSKPLVLKGKKRT